MELSFRYEYDLKMKMGLQGPIKYVVKSEKIISVQDRKVFDNARRGE